MDHSLYINNMVCEPYGEKIEKGWKIIFFIFIFTINIESLIPTFLGHTLGFYAGLLLATCGLFYFVVRKKGFYFLPPTVISYLILALTTITFFSAYFGIDFSNSLSHSTTMITIFIFFVILFNLTKYKTEEYAKYFARIIVITVSFSALIALLSLLSGSARRAVEAGIEYFKVSGTYTQINEFSSILAMVLPLAITLELSAKRKKDKLLLLLSSLLIIFAMLMTVSRGSIVAIFFGLSWLFYRIGKKRFKWICLFVVFFILIISMSNILEVYLSRFQIDLYRPIEKRNISIRYYTLLNAWNTFLKNPFLGIGAGNFYKINCIYIIYLDRYGLVWPHNSYLGMMAERGIFAFLCFLFIIIICFLEAFKIANIYKKTGNQEMSMLFIGYETCVLIYSLRIIFIDYQHQKLFWFIVPLINAVYFIIFRKGLWNRSRNNLRKKGVLPLEMKPLYQEWGRY